MKPASCGLEMAKITLRHCCLSVFSGPEFFGAAYRHVFLFCMQTRCVTYPAQEKNDRCQTERKEERVELFRAGLENTTRLLHDGD